MIISRTPYRISFLGGGTDYPAWYHNHGGAVLATTIDKYCYLTVRYLPPFFEHRYRIVYSKIETCQSMDEIRHPAVRECLRFMEFDRGLEIHHDGDLPARSGIGSSSSFTVGLAHALHALRGCEPSKRQLAEESIHIEQNCIQETVGSQDQVSAAYGGLNHIVFGSDERITVNPLSISAERIGELNSHLMLFYTGIVRTVSDVAQTYVENVDCNREQFRIMNDLVNQGLDVLTNGSPIGKFGELLNEAWMVKRALSCHVSSPGIDELYLRARKAGAIGVKIIGAGGGGFMVLFVPPDFQSAVREELHHLIHVPFKFEFSGSRIIFLDRQEDYSKIGRLRDCQQIAVSRETEILRARTR